MKVSWDDYSQYIYIYIEKLNSCPKPPTRYSIILSSDLRATLPKKLTWNLTIEFPRDVSCVVCGCDFDFEVVQLQSFL